MGRASRDKGRKGEREVALIFERAGFAVRGLERTGDHLIVGERTTMHVESKRQETCRPWAWWEQASSEAPAGAVPVVAFRRSRSPWLAIVPLEALAELAELAEGSTIPPRLGEL